MRGPRDSLRVFARGVGSGFARVGGFSPGGLRARFSAVRQGVARRGRDERGVVTVSVAILATALLLMTGIVVDGGRMLARHIEAHDVAASAARAGAQEVDRLGLHAGNPPHIVAAAASEAAASTATTSGASLDSVSVSADGTQVTVSVSMTQSMIMLGGGGQTLSGSATATAQRGVEGAS